VNGRRIRDALSGVCALIFLGALMFLGTRCIAGCDSAATQAQRAKNVLDVKAYDDALSECRKEGREMQSWSVYERCAKEADIRYGVDGGAK
jgi:outer membrane murein-binding lipoprotein Lpp